MEQLTAAGRLNLKSRPSRCERKREKNMQLKVSAVWGVRGQCACASVSETRNYFNPNTFPNRFGSCWLFQTYKISMVLLTIAYTMVTFFI